MKHSFIILTCGLLLVACSKKEKPLPLQFETQTIVNSIDNCIPDSANCTYIKYIYPLFKGNTALVDTLNNFIKHTLGVSQKISLIQTQKQFINDYLQSKKNTPNTNQIWYSNSTLTVLHQNQHIVCLGYNMDDFTGGAHGMRSTTYSNYWQSKATLIDLSDLFTDKNLKALEVIAENEFRTHHNLAAQADLDSAGYWFKDNVFALNNNFKITADGLTWLYNPYEIAPYSAGIIEVELSIDDFMPLLKEDAIKIWNEKQD